MADRFDIIARGGVNPAPKHWNFDYSHNGEKWCFYAFERRGQIEANAKVADLNAQGYEAKAIYVGKPHKRDIDD